MGPNLPQICSDGHQYGKNTGDLLVALGTAANEKQKLQRNLHTNQKKKWCQSELLTRKRSSKLPISYGKMADFGKQEPWKSMIAYYYAKITPAQFFNIRPADAGK